MRETIFSIVENVENENNSVVLGDSSVLVLVSNSDYSTLEKETLAKLIKAVKLDEADVSVLVLDAIPISLNDIISESEVSQVLIFGFIPKVLGLNIDIRRYQIAKLESVQLLFSDSIKVMSGDKDLKLQLWNSLKVMFLD